MFHHTLVLEPALRVYKLYNRSLVLRPLDGGGIGYRRRMVMRYPVRIRPTWRTRIGGVHHDERSRTDLPGWLYARRDGGVTWMRHAHTSADEVTRLRDCLKDVATIMALPAQSTAGEPDHVVGTVLDALLGMCRLAFVSVRLSGTEGGPSIETVRVDGSFAAKAQVSDITETIAASLRDVPWSGPPRARLFIGDTDLSVASAPLGVQGEIGVIVAGSLRLDFPTDTERLLLDVAASQAAIGLQHARLVRESERQFALACGQHSRTGRALDGRR